MSERVIPEAAVEAGLYAWGFSSQNIDERRELLRHILEAAAPHMLAEVWDQAIEAHKAWTWDDENMDPLANPYRPTLRPATHSLEDVAVGFGIDLDELRKEAAHGND